MEGFFFFLLFFLAGKACRSKRAQVSEQMIPVAVHRPKKRKKEKRGKKEKKGKERKIVDRVSEVAINCLLLVPKQMTWCS